MAWTDIASTDVDIDSAVDTDLMSALRNNTRALRTNLFGVHFAETSVGSASITGIVTAKVYVPDLPDYTGLQRKLTVEIDAKVDASGNEIQLQLSGFGTTGSAVSVTSTTYGLVELSIDIGSSYAGNTEVGAIQGKAVTGSGKIRSLNLVTWRLEY